MRCRRDARRSCASCRRWTPGQRGYPGRCGRGYTSRASDCCDAWSPRAGETPAHPGWRYGGMDGMPGDTDGDEEDV